MKVVARLNSSQDGQVFSVEGICQTLSSGHGNVPKILINEIPITNGQGHDADNTGGRNSMTAKHNWDIIVHNLQPRSGDPKKGGTGPLSRNDETTYSLDTGNTQAVEAENNIRRLTEIECERLQGFPDNWTKYGVYEKQVWINKKEKTFKIIEGVEKIVRTQRYKMCGNAITKTIAEILGRKYLNSIK